MAKGDPKFVRLPERLIHGCLGDVDGTGWFIGGRDVQPFPDEEDPQAQRFVREHLLRGNLEEASSNEHQTVRDANAEMRKLHLGQLDEHEAHDRTGLQEAQLQTLSRKTVGKLDRMRRSSSDDDDEDEVIEPDQQTSGGTRSAAGNASKSGRNQS